MENQFTNAIQEDEIDLLELFFVLKKRILALILAAIIGAGAMGVYSFFIATPIYSATSKLYVLSQSTSLTSFADIQISNSLAQDYQEMIKSRVVISQVKMELGLEYSYKEMVDMIEVTNPSDTRILNITVNNPDPEEAAAMANSLANISKNKISEIMAVDQPNLFEKAIVPKKPIEPQKTKNIILGFLLGFALAAAVIIAQFLIKDLISSEEDVENKIGLNVLVAIPKAKNVSSNKSSKTREKKGRHGK